MKDDNSFDPYHRWLGIPPKAQPADYYRLLGLERFEEDIEVIRDAATQRMGHVRSYHLGRHMELSQKILTELAIAKTCLLNPVRKQQYDLALREAMHTDRPADEWTPTPVPKASPPLPPPVVPPIARQRPKLFFVIGVVVAVSLLLYVGARFLPEATKPALDTVQDRTTVTAPSQAPPTTPEPPAVQPADDQAVRLASAKSLTAAPTQPLAPAPETLTSGSQKQAAERLKILVEVTNSIGMKLVLIPAGVFTMGSDDGYSDEDLVHRVRISKSFYLGVTEVTQGQYEQVMGTNPSNFTGDPQRPVETVSWDEAVEFCRKLSQKEGKEYRLPTEAEWEYACRAGSSTKWCCGDDESALGEYAWYDGNSDKTTHPVGQKRANAWGLYDMHGNVWEWCADGKARYESDTVSAPSGPSSNSPRVSRGGGWNFAARYCRSANRFHSEPGDRYGSLGLRVLLVIPGDTATRTAAPTTSAAAAPAGISRDVPQADITMPQGPKLGYQPPAISPELLHRLKGDSPKFSPDGTLLATLGEEGLQVWNVTSGTLVATIGPKSPTGFAFNPTGSLVAIASRSEIETWLLSETSQAKVKLSNERGGEVFLGEGMTFSPDGSTLATAIHNVDRGNFDFRLALWNVSTGVLTGTFEADGWWLGEQLMFSADGSILAASTTGKVLLWDVKTGKTLEPLEVNGSILRFLPNKKCLVNAGIGVWLFDLASGEVVRTYKPDSRTYKPDSGGDAGPVLALSPDVTLVATNESSDNKKIVVWKLETGEQVQVLEGHEGRVYSIAFSPDGSLLASGGQDQDKTVIIWKLKGK